MKKNIVRILVMFMVLSLFGVAGSNCLFAENSVSGSDIVTTTENGVLTIHAYDDFNHNGIDMDVWEETSGFGVSGNVLVNNGGKDKIKLKGNYAGFDHYTMSVDLIGIDTQWWLYSNGGIGISGLKNTGTSDSEDVIWAFHEIMNRPSNNKFYRSFNASDYGSVDWSNRAGDSLMPPRKLENQRRWNYSWSEQSIRINIDAQKNSSGTGYDVDYSLYTTKRNGGWNQNPILSFSKSFVNGELDFNELYLTALGPHNEWYVMLDDFEFTATKNQNFDTLEASWEDDAYKLTWEQVEGATKYTVMYESAGRFHTYSEVETDDPRQVFIADADSRSETAYKVVASLSESTVDSNQVYIGGDVTNAFEITGSFIEDDYKISWNKLSINSNPDLTYSLFYGETEGEINELVEGAESLSSNAVEFMIDNIQSSDKYYGKYIRLIANVDFDSYGITKYYSNARQISSEVKLSLSHVSDQFVFDWKADPLYSSYYLHKHNSKSNLSNPAVLAPNPDIFDKSEAKEGQIHFQVSDKDSEYINKFYILGGSNRGDIDYSNIVYTETGLITPTLVWTKDSDGRQLYSWDEFLGASQVKLYYGDSADSIENLMSDDLALITSNQFETIDSDYENKYVQARYFKDDIWYYSNIIRTHSLNLVKVEVAEDASDHKKSNLSINWKAVRWAEDGADETSRVSYYEFYYIDNSTRHVIATNLKDASYVVEDLYGDNKSYLGKTIYVDSICPASDKYGIEHKLTISSSAIIPRHIEFNSLSGEFLNENRDFKIFWQTPLELEVDQQTLTVSRYELFYGLTDKLITSSDEILESPYINLEKTYEAVNEASKYYHKFFKVHAEIDNIVYVSNIRYSEDTLVLDVNRFGDDFTLDWKGVENASEIKVYYSESENEDYQLFEPAKLSGNAKDYTIEDLDDINKNYNGHYFKVAALFDTHEILSNAVLIDVTKSLPSLNGEFQKDGSYALNWNSINWADDGYQLYYEEKVVDGDETEFINVPIENRIYNKTINSDSISNVEDSDYRNKYVRIVAIDGHLKAFSNAVLVNDPTISGSFEGILAEEEVNLRIGNRINAIYTFDVYKEMKQPYIKIELNGSKYLKFDGITAELLAVGKTSSEIIPLRLVTEVDSTNGVTIVYAHVLNEKQALESKADEKYRLSLSADVVVNEKNQVEVYDALRRHDETLKNWSLPYNIGDLNVEGVSLDDDMYIRYQAYWNIDDTVSENDQRHTSIEFFRTDVKVKNKKQLPGSM